MAATPDAAAVSARRIVVTGVVQGVGFRPFVYRLAQRLGVRGWVLNAGDGVTIVAEAEAAVLSAFTQAVRAEAPAAATVASLSSEPVASEGFRDFRIRESTSAGKPTVRISPDLPACADCLREFADPNDRRFDYAYINCTNCGPRYSIVRSLPYDRPRTTMSAWPLCAACAREYHDPADRRFHAQPVACATCGPAYVYRSSSARTPEQAGSARSAASDAASHRDPNEPGSHRAPSEPGSRTTPGNAVDRAVSALRRGEIVAVKGIGGYHLACDARDATAVSAMRERKYRKERPFAIMARDIAVARTLVRLDVAAETLLQSTARPIVLAPARETFAGVAPDNDELGVMLPYAPLHHQLFARGAPDALVMTSANRSSEPIAYTDDDALNSLAGIADGFLIGERPIARRVDDSIARSGPYGPTILRRSRGYAPAAVATLPTKSPILAVGGDLKSAIALAVDGAVFASQHLGDLDQHGAFVAFKATVADLCAMYEVDWRDLIVAYDAHPQYRSSQFAQELAARAHVPVQHHRAHVASVLAERGAFDLTVTGIAFDGTGYGDDGSIWGGEAFTGSLDAGFVRAMHLRTTPLPGGDAAARSPVQSAAGFLWELDTPDLHAPPFDFPKRYALARELIRKDVQTFSTTSVGRLFDTAAAIVGFTREISFEGQAAMWLEHRARAASSAAAYAFDVSESELDYRPVLAAMLADRARGRAPEAIARGFHIALADAVVRVAERLGYERVVASGGVFQNGLLIELLAERFADRLWLNAAVPPNDGGICLGQAALAAIQNAPSAPA